MIPTYIAKLKKNSKGVFNFSFVNKPAMLGQVVHFSEENKPETFIKLAAIDEEKRMVIGLVLQPDLDVYRRDKKTGYEYNIRFDADTIEELLIEYAKQGHHNESSLEHSKKIEGVTFFEHWMVKDPKMDKSALYGLNHKAGSWLTMGKVNNDEAWEGVKDGTYKGLSIDGILDLDLMALSEEKINIKTEIEMSESVVESNKNLADKIVELTSNFTKWFAKDKKETKVELASVKSGDLEIYFDGETMSAGQSVWMENEAGEQMPLPVGEYPIEGERMLIVTEEGMVSEIQEAMPAEEMPAPAEMDAEVAAPVEAAPTGGESEAVERVLKSLLMKFKTQLDTDWNEKIKENNKVYLSKIETLEKQVVGFGMQPKAHKIVSAPLKFEDMTNHQKAKYKRANA
jgi:hypothetical protein